MAIVINYNEKLRPALTALREILIDLRYDWLNKNLKGPGYFLEPSTAGLPPAVNQYLTLIGPRQSLAMNLLRFGGSVDRKSLLQIFPDSLIDELLELGLLVDTGGELRL